MVVGAPSFFLRFAADHRALFLARHCLRSRFRISRYIMARRRRTVETGNPVSAMDGVGQPRIWRASLYFLSAPFLAACARAELARSMGLRPGGLHRLGTDFCGSLRICLCAPYAAAKFGALRRGLLSGQSQRTADDLFPQRLRGTSRLRIFPATFSHG